MIVASFFYNNAKASNGSNINNIKNKKKNKENVNDNTIENKKLRYYFNMNGAIWIYVNKHNIDWLTIHLNHVFMLDEICKLPVYQVINMMNETGSGIDLMFNDERGKYVNDFELVPSESVGKK